MAAESTSRAGMLNVSAASPDRRRLPAVGAQPRIVVGDELERRLIGDRDLAPST